MIQPFVQGAKTQTMLRDFERLRRAIRNHDSFETEKAWEDCERWLSAVTPETSPAKPIKWRVGVSIHPTINRLTFPK